MKLRHTQKRSANRLAPVSWKNGGRRCAGAYFHGGCSFKGMVEVGR